MAHLPSVDRSALTARRDQLAQALKGQPLLLSAGRTQARTYAANPYDFRAASHYLYVAGVPVPDGHVLFDGRDWALYLPEPGPDDTIWEGAVPSPADYSARTGLPVLARGELFAALEHVGRARIATLPTPDAGGNLELSRLLGREVRYGQLGDADVALAEAMIALRLRLDAAAVRESREAAVATAALHAAGMKATRPGLREAHVRAAMEAEALARDVPLAYHPIVTVHGEVLHNHAHHHELKAGDLLLADVGAESAGGWACDVTRTWPVSGRFSPTQRDLYSVVLAAQKEAIAAARPGVGNRTLHLTAGRALARGLCALGILTGDPEERVADGTLYLFFPHGIGHLLGLDVHDMEDLGDRAGYAPGRVRSEGFGIKSLRLDRDLAPGMYITVEPGLYLVPAILEHPELGGKAKGRIDFDVLARFRDVRGIRIEDDVLVTDGAPDVVTRAIPKEPDDVEAAMR